MSHLLARIMLALLMLPLAGIVFGVAAVLLVDLVFGYSRDDLAVMLAGVLGMGFIVAYWVMLWRSTVRWSSRRVALTFAAGAVAVVLAAGVGVLGGLADPDFGLFIAFCTAMLLWLVFTIFVWRETPEERQARVRAGGATGISCPRCGYNLTGLSQAACPECVAQFTLEELMASQRERESEAIQPEPSRSATAPPPGDQCLYFTEQP